MDPGHPGFDVQPTAGNHFAWVRTVLALQRTLMASVRTSVSLIGFGFTVAQFFEKLRAKVPPEMRVEPDVSRDLGLLLIGAGVISLVLFTWRYHAALVYLRTGDFAVLATPEARTLHRPTYIVALTVIFIGVAAFVSVFMRF